MPDTTSRLGISTPLGTEAPDTNAAYKEIADKVDAQAAMFGQGTLAARPVSTPGSPGKQGRFYMVTSGDGVGSLYYDHGTGWIHVNSLASSQINQAGNLADRPAATAVAAGTKYFAIDQRTEYISDGTNWTRVSLPAGVCAPWFASAAPTGWVKYDGSSLPGSSGIYADLYAHLGNSLITPNTKGKVIVGQDPSDADFDALLEIRGAKTHTLTQPEIPSHTHGLIFNGSYMLIGAGTATGYAGGGGDGVPDTSAQVGATGGGGAHNNIQPSIVGLYIAKL